MIQMRACGVNDKDDLYKASENQYQEIGQTDEVFM